MQLVCTRRMENPKAGGFTVVQRNGLEKGIKKQFLDLSKSQNYQRTKWEKNLESLRLAFDNLKIFVAGNQGNVYQGTDKSGEHLVKTNSYCIKSTYNWMSFKKRNDIFTLKYSSGTPLFFTYKKLGWNDTRILGVQISFYFFLTGEGQDLKNEKG